jgi:group I intron endonuclease
MNQGIYKIENKINSKVYVGQVCRVKGGFEERYEEHGRLLNANRHYNRYLQNAWNKYGSINFSFKILETINDIDKLDDREQYWLDLTWEYNYNICPIAGRTCRGRKHTEDTKSKIGDANRKRVWTKESRKKLSNSQKNRKMSDETRLKMKLSHEGKIHSQKTKDKIAKANCGRIFSQKTKIKMSESRKGRINSKESIIKKEQSCRNLPGKGSSKFKGVAKHGNGWRVRITKGKKEHYLGRFKDPIEAAKNYDYHAISLFGKDCYLNFPNYDYSNFIPIRKIKNG